MPRGFGDQALEPLVERVAAPLDQPIRVQQDRRAWLEPLDSLRIAGPRVRAQGHRSTRLQKVGAPGRIYQERRWMTGAGEGEGPLREVEREVDGSGGLALIEASHDRVDLRQGAA